MKNDKVREALERVTGGREPDVSRLLDSVPWMMREAARRSELHRKRTLLAASIPQARRAIPRLAAATAVLVVAGAVLWFTGAQPAANDTSGDIGELIVRGNGLTDRLIVERILEPEEER